MDNFRGKKIGAFQKIGAFHYFPRLRFFKRMKLWHNKFWNATDGPPLIWNKGPKWTQAKLNTQPKD